MDNIIIKQVINELFERGLVDVSEYNKILVLINSKIISSKVKQSELEKLSAIGDECDTDGDKKINRWV